jgi:ATP-dependent Clp protease ATP-binding subunit ClpA
MFSIDLQVTAVLQSFDDGKILFEPLLFPEMCCLGDRAPALRRIVKNLVIRTAMEDPPFELHRRRLPAGAQAASVTLTLEPAARSLAWQEPVTLRFPIVRWRHPAPEALQAATPEAELAFVPALGIEVIAPRGDALEKALEEEIRTSLMRLKAVSLQPLVWFQRVRDIQLSEFHCAIELKTPKELAREELDAREHGKPVLVEVGVDLAKEPLRPGYELENIISRMVDTLGGAQPRCVLLVGPSGVGKTAAVHELVRERAHWNLAATPFWATTGARLVSGMSGFGMWQERCTKLIREASQQRAILHLGNLLELMDVGKSEHQTQGIASFLRPYLSRGELLGIAECTPEQLPLIERQEPQLLATFVQIPIAEPSPDQSRRILTSFAKEGGTDHSPMTTAAIDQVDRLHRRYATYSAFPGRPLRFVRNLLADRAPNRELTAADVTREFSRESGLPLSLLEETERLDLERTRDWFAKRVIGQSEPVDLMVDMLATIKAVLTRPRKPVASLLFIGPTGVGKTEMAKSLAEFLFGSSTRLTRFDMSEYADPNAVDRLIGGTARGEGQLTARIREQPFSVLLLDEVEKAHPLLFDLLLQVLGEGRLTDKAGRLADFCNSVVIMTSNLGAETAQRGGFGLGQSSDAIRQARQLFLQAVQEFFRPELFNRIDHVVPFAPLDESTILKIAHRQLDLVRQRDGVRYRDLTLNIDPEVAAWLARHGMDSRYGARPLKRTIDRELLAPLGNQLNCYLAQTPLKVRVAVRENRLDIQAKADVRETAVSDAQADTESVKELQALRRDLQKLFRCSAALEMDNEIHRLQLLEKRLFKRGRFGPEDVRRMSQLASWRELRTNFDALFTNTCALEDQTLLGLLRQEGFNRGAVNEGLKSAHLRWEANLLKLYLQRFEKPDDAIVAVFGEQRRFLQSLAEAYYRVVLTTQGKADLWQFLPGPASQKDEAAPLTCRLVLDPARIWSDAASVATRVYDPLTRTLRAEELVEKPMEGVVGLGLVIHAPGALPRFTGEGGLHVFRTQQGNGCCLVDTSERGWQEYTPPSGMDRRGNIGQQERRRTYDFVHETLEDPRLPGKLYANADCLPEALAQALQQSLNRNLQEILNS